MTEPHNKKVTEGDGLAAMMERKGVWDARPIRVHYEIDIGRLARSLPQMLSFVGQFKDTTISIHNLPPSRPIPQIHITEVSPSNHQPFETIAMTMAQAEYPPQQSRRSSSVRSPHPPCDLPQIKIARSQRTRSNSRNTQPSAKTRPQGNNRREWSSGRNSNLRVGAKAHIKKAKEPQELGPEKEPLLTRLISDSTERKAVSRRICVCIISLEFAHKAAKPRTVQKRGGMQLDVEYIETSSKSQSKDGRRERDLPQLRKQRWQSRQTPNAYSNGPKEPKRAQDNSHGAYQNSVSSQGLNNDYSAEELLSVTSVPQAKDELRSTKYRLMNVYKANIRRLSNFSMPKGLFKDPL